MLAAWKFRSGPAIELAKAYLNIKALCVCVFLSEFQSIWGRQHEAWDNLLGAQRGLRT